MGRSQQKQKERKRAAASFQKLDAFLPPPKRKQSDQSKIPGATTTLCSDSQSGSEIEQLSQSDPQQHSGSVDDSFSSDGISNSIELDQGRIQGGPWGPAPPRPGRPGAPFHDY